MPSNAGPILLVHKVDLLKEYRNDKISFRFWNPDGAALKQCLAHANGEARPFAAVQLPIFRFQVRPVRFSIPALPSIRNWIMGAAISAPVRMSVISPVRPG